MRYYLNVEAQGWKSTKFPIVDFLFWPFVTRSEDLTTVER
jgi:hypothetical protein